MRLIGWIVVVSMGLALLRLATILALILLGGGILWAIIAHPTNTIALLTLFAAISIAKASPVLAVLLMCAGLAVWSRDSGAVAGG